MIDPINPIKEPIKEAVSKLFGLDTPIAKCIMELILLLVLIGLAGYLYEHGPSVLKLPAGMFIAMGTFFGFMLFFRIASKFHS